MGIKLIETSEVTAAIYFNDSVILTVIDNYGEDFFN